MFQLIGVHLTEAQQASPLRAFRGRFPWLLCNIAGGLLAAFLSFLYQDELAWRGAVLAVFIPVVLALSESVSIQSVSLALQTLQVRRASWSMLGGKTRQELLTGLCLGGACGMLVGLTGLVWIGEGRIAVCLLVGILGGVAAAAVIGFAMPVFLHLMQRDPQVAAGPIALALADMLTLLLYFNLARSLLVD
jgi:magnesium transporter